MDDATVWLVHDVDVLVETFVAQEFAQESFALGAISSEDGRWDASQGATSDCCAGHGCCGRYGGDSGNGGDNGC